MLRWLHLCTACALFFPALPGAIPPDSGNLEGFDSIEQLPAAKDRPARLVMGDTHGLLHIYEARKGGSYEEVWISDYMEGRISGLFIVDINDDDLDEIVVFTDLGRIHYLDSAAYKRLWSNSPSEYDRITGMTIHNIDDDPQPELVFCADGRLIVYDGKQQFEQWRSDQTGLTASQLLVADVDGDGEQEIVLNEGYVFDARFYNLEWQYSETFGQRMGALDVDNDGILEIVGEFQNRFLRVYDVDLRREKSLRP